jgi:hypothetical protein
LFVIIKEYQGREFSRVEHTDAAAQVERLAAMLIDISADPRFSLRVEVKPQPLKGSKYVPYLPSAFPQLLGGVCEHRPETEPRRVAEHGVPATGGLCDQLVSRDSSELCRREVPGRL